ncbi:hypothetical protein IJM86_08175 [bacterium]|nr:hypothetical protein [bacterium]
METIRDFRGEDGLTRAEMSKIISIFAKEYLEAKEKEIKACSNFKDITKIKSDLHDYIITSCKL